MSKSVGVKLNLDLSAYEAEGDGLQLMPKGNYAVEITRTEGLETKSSAWGTGYQLVVYAKVLNGEFEGCEFRDGITLQSDMVNDKGERMAENIGRKRLKKLCEIHNIPCNPLKDSSLFHGKKYILVNDHREDKNESGKFWNQIKAWKEFDSEFVSTGKRSDIETNVNAKSESKPDIANEPPAFGSSMVNAPAATQESKPEVPKAPWAV